MVPAHPFWFGSIASYERSFVTYPLAGGLPSSGTSGLGGQQVSSPSIGKPRRVRGQRTPAHLDKLAEIKNEAARCFYAHGYAATDVRTIADHVGLQVSTLYNCISGKEELLYLIMRDGMTEIAASLEAATGGLTDPRERLRAAVRSHVLHHAHRQFLAWVGHVEVRALTGDYLAEILARRRPPADHVRHPRHRPERLPLV